MPRNDLSEEVQVHCRQIDRCNQRGGRMLSIVDLIEAGTFTPALAAYALTAIGKGTSFLVGASPGGAGKTTVMGALLNFVPPGVELAVADGEDAIRTGLDAPAPRRCYIAHEIGPGPYYAYLWGRELRAFFDLPLAGHMLASNLHADHLAETRRQVCRENGIPEAALRRVGLMVFLDLRGRGRGARRTVSHVLESDGQSEHRCVFEAGSPGDPGRESRLVTPDEADRARATIDALLADGARTIEQVRSAVVLRA